MSMSIRLQQENPKREGTASYDRYEQYKRAVTREQFLEMGGTKADYRHDLQKGFIKEYGQGKSSEELPVVKKQIRKGSESSKPKKRAKVGGKFGVNYCIKGRIDDFDDVIFKNVSETKKRTIIDTHDAVIRSLNQNDYVDDVPFFEIAEANEAAVQKMQQLLDDTVHRIEGATGLYFGDEDQDGFPVPTTLETMTTTTLREYHTNYELVISLFVDVLNEPPCLKNSAEIKISVYVRPL